MNSAQFSFFFAFLGLLLTMASCQTPSSNPLTLQFQQIADSLDGKLGISALHLESGESVSFQGNKPFPMQSVYKFPIAMVMLHEIDKGAFSLADSITVDKSEYIPKAGHSPLRNQYPHGCTKTLEDILQYNVSQSDGTACDVLLRLLGGPAKVQEKLKEWGIHQIAIATTEMVQVANDSIQYQNWAHPDAMNQLLQIFHQGKVLSERSTTLLTAWMSISNKWFDRRLKGLLPKGTQVIHKTGTARTYNGLTRATNDAGIIILPNGNHLAISVFVSDSYDSQEKREKTIAQVAKATYDYWNKKE
ncbi:MAG: class A beta-lactamase [Bacteroidota bacterium]